jgi:hypothetical protein
MQTAEPGPEPAEQDAAVADDWLYGLSDPPDATLLKDVILPMDSLYAGGGKYRLLQQAYAQKEMPILTVGDFKTGTTKKELLHEIKLARLPGRAAMMHIARVLSPKSPSGYAFVATQTGDKRKRGGTGANKPVSPQTGAPLNFASWRFPMTIFKGVPLKGQTTHISQRGLLRAMDNTLLVMQDIPQLGMYMRPKEAVNVWISQMEEHAAPYMPHLNTVCSHVAPLSCARPALNLYLIPSPSFVPAGRDQVDRPTREARSLPPEHAQQDPQLPPHKDISYSRCRWWLEPSPAPSSPSPSPPCLP